MASPERIARFERRDVKAARVGSTLRWPSSLVPDIQLADSSEVAHLRGELQRVVRQQRRGPVAPLRSRGARAEGLWCARSST